MRAILDDLSPGKVAPIRYLMVEAVVQGSQLSHPAVDEALEFLRGDDDATRRREVRRQVALLSDDVSREPGPDWTPRRAAVKVLLDALETTSPNLRTRSRATPAWDISPTIRKPPSSS
ncbi:hypothetical protein ACWEPN_05060 [Nonomuraea wenchangensis]